jgi:hypothetical protein
MVRWGYRQRPRISHPLTSKDFITTFTTQNHLHTHRLDLPTQEVHRSRGANSRDIVGLQMVNDILNRIQTLLDGESILMMSSTEEGGGFSRGDEVGSAW